MAAATINLRLAAVRRLAYEAADCGLLSPELAAGIQRVKGAKRLGLRIGNWLSAEQAKALLQAPDAETMTGKRDRAILAVLLGCGLRRSETVRLNMEHFERRDDHWAIVDLFGKGGHVRSVPVPDWVKQAMDHWTGAARVQTGRVFRCVTRNGFVWGSGITEKVIWWVVRRYAKRSSATSLLMICGARAPVCVTSQEASWNKSSFCWAMLAWRPRNNTSAANSGFAQQSIIRSASNRRRAEEQ